MFVGVLFWHPIFRWSLCAFFDSFLALFELFSPGAGYVERLGGTLVFTMVSVCFKCDRSIFIVIIIGVAVLVFLGIDLIRTVCWNRIWNRIWMRPSQHWPRWGWNPSPGSSYSWSCPDTIWRRRNFDCAISWNWKNSKSVVSSDFYWHLCTEIRVRAPWNKNVPCNILIHVPLERRAFYGLERSFHLNTWNGL